MNKFKNEQEYLDWCERMVTQIYYARIAMNEARIIETLDEISSKLHIREGDRLIK